MWGCRWALVNWLHPGWLLFEPTALLNCCAALGEPPHLPTISSLSHEQQQSPHTLLKVHQSWPSPPGLWPPVTYGFTHNIWVHRYTQKVCTHELETPGIHLNPSCGAWLSWPLLMVEILIFSSLKATTVWLIFLSGCNLPVYLSIYCSGSFHLWKRIYIYFFFSEHKLASVGKTQLLRVSLILIALSIANLHRKITNE